MTALGRSLRGERDMWQAVWKQVETFLDRIDSAAGEDGGYVKTMCALFPVFGVIERTRKRSLGYGLDDALAAAPRGAGITLASGLVSGKRIPGVEDCEFAVSGMKVNDEGEIDDKPHALLWRTTKISQFRDDKHGTDVVLRAPAYDFGELAGVSIPGLGTAAVVVEEVIDDGFFPRREREKATNGDEFAFVTWKQVRDKRLSNLDPDEVAAGADTGRLATQLDDLGNAPTPSQLIMLGSYARTRAGRCRDDAKVLDDARAKLDEVGAADASEAVAAASAALGSQAAAYDRAAAMLGDGYLSSQERLDIKAVLGEGDGVPGPSGLPLALELLDVAAAPAMQEAIENRIGYPDGPLRMLRMLEFTLRFFWDHRKRWMGWRHKLVLAKLYRRYLGGFTTSLDRVMKGQHSGLPVPEGTTVGKDTLTGATELGVTPADGSNQLDLLDLIAGQLVVVGGDRPSAAPVITVLYDGKKTPPQRLKITAMPVSVAAEPPGLPGIAGMIQKGAPMRTRLSRPFTRDELLRGKSASGANRDALVQTLIAHRTRLALVCGDQGGGDRPAVPAIEAPYASIARFAVEGTVEPSMTRVFLAAVPALSASGNGEVLGLARPGELMLLRGRDAEGEWWQTAIEVDRSEVLPASEARADEPAATAVPVCFCHDDPVMVVYVRSMRFPSPLEQVVLHRDFRGFGARSLLTGVLLPADLDSDTTLPTENGHTVRRDPELRAAAAVFDDWLPKETA